MNASQVMDVNMRSMPKKSKPVLRSIEHERSSNGGHVFTHRMANDGGSYHEPEVHTFGKDDGKGVMAHFAKYAGLPKGDKDSAAGAAT
jgi:hypothetical protein